MGKIFPQRSTLKESPSLVGETLQLIEKSFQYTAPQSFSVDFAPLMDPSNHQHCFIYRDETGKVIAHIGAKEKTLSLHGQDHVISLLGGIAVDESRRGEGVFRTLMEDVISELRSDCAFFLLWSDQEKLYKKFGFTLCGAQYEYPMTPGPSTTFEKTKYSALPATEKEQVQNLFSASFASVYLTPTRTEKDWGLLERMDSADLFVKRSNGEIGAYFFMNKGQDLPGIIYEYGSTGSLEALVQELRTIGTVWTGVPISETNTQQFQFMLSPADRKLFAAFVRDYTREKFLLRDINLIKGEAFFDFNDETLSLEIPEFLRGVLGPGTFEELEELTPLFLSGIDSI